jgi:hypothetical protein
MPGLKPGPISEAAAGARARAMARATARVKYPASGLHPTLRRKREGWGTRGFEVGQRWKDNSGWRRVTSHPSQRREGWGTRGFEAGQRWKDNTGWCRAGVPPFAEARSMGQRAAFRMTTRTGRAHAHQTGYGFDFVCGFIGAGGQRAWKPCKIEEIS